MESLKIGDTYQSGQKTRKVTLLVWNFGIDDFDVYFEDQDGHDGICPAKDLVQWMKQ